MAAAVDNKQLEVLLSDTTPSEEEEETSTGVRSVAAQVSKDEFDKHPLQLLVDALVDDSWSNGGGGGVRGSSMEVNGNDSSSHS